MAVATILGFFIGLRVQSAEIHHRSNFHQNRAILCGDNAIFRIFQMAAFLKLQYFIG